MKRKLLYRCLSVSPLYEHELLNSFYIQFIFKRGVLIFTYNSVRNNADFQSIPLSFVVQHQSQTMFTQISHRPITNPFIMVRKQLLCVIIMSKTIAWM